MLGNSKYRVASREHRDGCLFCRICQQPSGQRILFSSDRLIVIEDIRPAGRQHLLAIPRCHIANTDSLQPNDLSLLRELQHAGEQVLIENCKSSKGKFSFGFHRPPYRSQDHLHLHCFEDIYWHKAWKYSSWLPSVWLPYSKLVKMMEEGP